MYVLCYVVLNETFLNKKDFWIAIQSNMLRSGA